MQKLKNIEFLRVVGCLTIVLLHFFGRSAFGGFAKYNPFFKDLPFGCSYAAKAVDLFFILSGFFLVLTTDFSGNLWEFIKKKLIRFYPVTIFTLLGFFVMTRFCRLKFLYCENFLTLCNITGTPLSLSYGNLSGYWYISNMFWIFLFIFFCRKNFSKKSIDLCIALLSFFSYAFIIQKQNGIINGNLNAYGIVNVGLMRGLGGIGIGYLIGEWYKSSAEKLHSLNLPVYVKLLLTIVEGYSIFFIISRMMFSKPEFRNEIVFIAVFVIIILCFLLKQGYISRLLDCDIWVKLSMYTFSIYLTHFLVLAALFFFLWVPKNCRAFALAHPLSAVIISIAAALAFGVLTYHCVERPAAKYLKRFLSPKPDAGKTEENRSAHSSTDIGRQ